MMMENLVIQTAFLGDLVLSLPLIRQFAELYPESSMSVVCRKGLGEILHLMKFVDQVIEVDKSNPVLWRQQKRWLQEREFHHIVSPHQSWRTAALVRGLSSCGEKVGFNLWWNPWAFTRRVVRPDFFPDPLRQLSLLTSLNSDFAEEFSLLGEQQNILNSTDLKGPVDFRSIPLPSWAQLRLADLKIDVSSRAKERLIFVAPGSVWATKRWTVEGFQNLIKKLREQDWRVKLVGSADEKELCAQIAQVDSGVENFAGRWSLTETINHFCFGQALIANDSGAMHLGALAQLPTVAIFGPTTLSLGFRPWQSAAFVVQENLSCRPCGRHGHDQCPLGTHDCMKKISWVQVFESLMTLLSS